ncbi:hypothetical protein SAMN05660199_00625 [Klenkia soli]|uniref:OmpR/PhoB-type domain-containing protein n=1 Tax=Klenkia soli TaxID=1052260 RepID=A0A1H0E238_9ACTN|nr:phytochrome sensor protein [Klenkia soli]SDN76395.1 hypothetical protein SAMN05660199_00625 [Klenkia soli]
MSRSSPGPVPHRPRFALAPHLPLDDGRAVEEARAWLLAMGVDAPADPPLPAVRPEVWASWRRSVAAGVDPALDRPAVVRGPGEVAAVLAGGPWTPAVGRLQADLVEDAAADTLSVVLADAAGVVLWAGGSVMMGHRTARVGLVPGASWAEPDVGTNAVGTCLATGVCTQVLRAEHHLVAARVFAGAAAPVRDRSGRVRGAVGLLGGDHVATPAVLALVRFVADALGRELTEDAGSEPGGTQLRVLGRDRAVLHGPTGDVVLSPKHSDLLLSLALAGAQDRGRTAEELAADCWDGETPTTTVRAEVHRLRRLAPGVLRDEHPYRLQRPLEVDAVELLALLRRGAHRQALQVHRGPVLPTSTSPVAAQLRRRVADHLRQALVAHAHVDLLLEYADRAEGADAAEAWQALVDRLPVGSARRTTALLRLDEVERTLLGS